MKRLIVSLTRSSIAWVAVLVLVMLVGVDMVTCAESSSGICLWSGTSRGIRDAARETGGAMIAGSLVGIALVGVQEAIETRRESRTSDRFTQELLVADAQLLASNHSIESLVAKQIKGMLADFVELTVHLRAGTGHEDHVSRVLSAYTSELTMVTRLRTMRPLLHDLQAKSSNIEIAKLRQLADEMVAEERTTDERLALARRYLQP